MEVEKFAEWRNASRTKQMSLLRETMYMYQDPDPQMVQIHGKKFARDHKMNGMQEVFNEHCKKEDLEMVKPVLDDLNAAMGRWCFALRAAIKDGTVVELPRLDEWELEKNRDSENYQLAFKPYRFAHWSGLDYGRNSVVKDDSPFNFVEKYARKDKRHYCWVLKAKVSNLLEPPKEHTGLIRKYINYSITKPKK